MVVGAMARYVQTPPRMNKTALIDERQEKEGDPVLLIGGGWNLTSATSCAVPSRSDCAKHGRWGLKSRGC